LRGRLNSVSLSIDQGETVGLIGPSGSGKTSLARCLAGFETPDSGEVWLAPGTRVQLIFQQPAASLNPRFTAAEIVEEPLVILRKPRAGAAQRAIELVGLPSGCLQRRALAFSGGERQRLAIARALVTEPGLLILDESFAGLDAVLQQQIAGMLRELQQRLGLSYLLIAHDLELVGEMAGRLVVMEAGNIVEEGVTADVLAAPRHPLTQRLVEAARVLSAGWPR
jgi:ABC-type dipeptide/oligopeptide/nickel transport system ATPase subunit